MATTNQAPDNPAIKRIVYASVPCFVEKMMRDATDTSGNRHKVRKLLRFVQVRKETADYLGIDVIKDGESTAWEEFLKSLSGGGAGSLFQFGGELTDRYNGASDTAPTSLKRKPGWLVKHLNSKKASGIGVTVKLAIKTKKGSNRSVHFTFPKVFTRLMIIQALGSMIAIGKKDLLATQTCKIAGVLYPLSVGAVDKKWGQADCGAWILKAIPDKGLFTTDSPSIAGDSPAPGQQILNLANQKDNK